MAVFDEMSVPSLMLLSKRLTCMLKYCSALVMINFFQLLSVFVG